MRPHPADARREAELTDLLDRSRPRVAVVGGYGVALTFALARMPEAGETVIGQSFSAVPGGKGSNQAIGAARLGASVSLCTAIGDDSFAQEGRTLWLREGVGTGHVVTVPDSATMVGGVLVDSTGENRIAIVPGALARLTRAHVAAFEEQLAGADVCLVQLEIPLDAALEALRIARRAGTTTILDPAPAPAPGTTPDEFYELADFLTPNASEAAALAGVADGTPEELAERLRSRGAERVVVTLGAGGALLATGSGTELVPAHPAPTVVDSTGAGDAFNAALAVALAEGRAEREAVEWGCVAGACMVAVPGVIPGLPFRNVVTRELAGSTDRAGEGGVGR